MKIGAVNDFRKDLSDEILLIASEGFDFVDLTLTLEVFTPDRRYLLLSKKYLEEILAR